MSKSAAVKVWDPLVRIFHWSLVAFFTIAFVTGEEENVWHIYTGYAVLGLIAFRILWGFIGSEHARFSDFIFGPGKVIQYLGSLLGGKPQRYLGHNPAGGYMVLLMLVVLLAVTITGVKVYGLEGHGPLASSEGVSILAVARADGDEGENEQAGENESEEFWEEIHEAASYFMLALIGLHILGVIVSSRLHKENLVKAMITGNKEAEQP